MAHNFPSRSFSKARLTGAHVAIDKQPDLLDGEQYSVFGGENSIGSVTLYDTSGKVQAEEGRLWVTNYRTVLRFYVSFYYYFFYFLFFFFFILSLLNIILNMIYFFFIYVYLIFLKFEFIHYILLFYFFFI